MSQVPKEPDGTKYHDYASHNREANLEVGHPYKLRNKKRRKNKKKSINKPNHSDRT